MAVVLTLEKRHPGKPRSIALLRGGGESRAVSGCLIRDLLCADRHCSFVQLCAADPVRRKVADWTDSDSRRRVVVSRAPSRPCGPGASSASRVGYLVAVFLRRVHLAVSNSLVNTRVGPKTRLSLQGSTRLPRPLAARRIRRGRPSDDENLLTRRREAPMSLGRPGRVRLGSAASGGPHKRDARKRDWRRRQAGSRCVGWVAPNPNRAWTRDLSVDGREQMP